MGMVSDCCDHDRLWNERLDDRNKQFRSAEAAARLTDHAATCESCRCHGVIYADLESSFGSMALIPPASIAAIERWQVAALAASPVASRGRGPSQRLTGVVARVGSVAALAASVMIGTKALLPTLFPIESAPRQQAEHSSLLFEEAFVEATTMTWELAREVSAPAARISSEALGWRDESVTSNVMPIQYRSVEASTPATKDPDDAPQMESISGSARHAFRFLIGTATDESGDSGSVEGY